MALTLLIFFSSLLAGHMLFLTMAIHAPLGAMRTLTEVAGSSCTVHINMKKVIIQYASQLLGQLRLQRQLWPY